MTHIALFGDLVHGPTQANRRRPGPDIGHEPTTEGGLAVTLSVTEQSGSGLLTVTVQGPARFASLHTVDKASLGAGVPHCLVPPAIHESEPGAPELHAYPGLWIYDRTAFARAGSSFAVSRSWTHDGGAVAGETATVYHRRAGDELVSIGLVEAVLGLDGGGIAAEAAPLPAAPPEPEPEPKPDLPTLKVSDADCAVIVEGVDAMATHVTLSIAAPSPYAGSYQVALVDIVAGQPVCLVPPEVTEGADGTLSARAALWVYDPAVMTTFSVDYAWIDSDGVAIPDADATEWTRTTYRAVRLRETATGLVADVTALSGTVPAITVPATVVSAARPIIPTAGLLADHRAMTFAASMTFDTTPATAFEHILSSGSGALGLSRRVSPETTFRLQHGSVEGFASISTSVVNVQDAARPRVLMVSSIDLDKTADFILHFFITNGAVSQTRALSTASISGTDRLVGITSMLAQNAAGNLPFLGTVHGFIWLHSAFIAPETLRNALFEPVATSIDPTGFMPRLLPDNGTVTIGGSPVTPLVFLRGNNFDQFDDGGTWKVPNRGSAGGNFTLPMGAFA